MALGQLTGLSGSAYRLSVLAVPAANLNAIFVWA